MAIFAREAVFLSRITSAIADIISLTTYDAPKFAQMRLKEESVYPAIGASEAIALGILHRLSFMCKWFKHKLCHEVRYYGKNYVSTKFRKYHHSYAGYQIDISNGG